MAESVKVELLGMLPELFKMCPKGSDVCALEPAEDQMKDYPPEVRANQEAFGQIYNQLLSDFGGRAVPITVGYMSPRGFWLSLKHHLQQELTVVVDGRAIPVDEGYEPVRQAVTEALSR